MTRYPLSWPEGWRRIPAARRKRGLFAKRDNSGSYARTREISVSDAVGRVLNELRMFGVQEGDAIISTNLRVRLDGLPRSDQAQPQDPGVAVYWERPGEKGTKVMAIDIYDRVEHNLAAVAATLEAMRAIERHGGAQILERAFTGFTALPNPDKKREWWIVLGVPPEERSLDNIKACYRQKAARVHPDRGGSGDAMAELNLAMAEAELRCTSRPVA